MKVEFYFGITNNIRVGDALIRDVSCPTIVIWMKIPDFDVHVSGMNIRNYLNEARSV
jgi:hypothetical protein